MTSTMTSESKFLTISLDDWRRSIRACRTRKNIALEQIRAEAARRKAAKLNKP